MPSLKPSDLDGVILSYISIDDFQPKTGHPEEVIVVTFYSHDENAAHDLKQFIETGFFNILDVENSDVPDNKNRSLVFVEFRRDNEFIKSLIEMIRDIENVSGKMKWVFSSYMNEEVTKLTPKNLKKKVFTDPEEYKKIIEKEEKRIRRDQKIKEINNHIKNFVMKSHIMKSKFHVNNKEKIVTFYYSDPDFQGSFDYKFYGIKGTNRLKNDLEGIKSREGTLPTSVLKPLAVLFGDNYKVYNKDNIIFVIPEFNLNMVLMLGVR